MSFFALLLLFLVFPPLSLRAITPRCSVDILVPQLEKILGEVETKNMSANRRVLRNIVQRWKQGVRDINIRSLYQMAYSFNLPPSRFIRSENISDLINPQDLTTRAFLPDEEIDQAVRITNEVLVQSIQRPGLTRKKNAARLEISKSLSINILLHGHVPKLDVLDKILLKNGDALEDFFRRVENREDFHLNPQGEVSINTFGRRGNYPPRQRRALEFLDGRLFGIQELLKEKTGLRIRDIKGLTINRTSLGKRDFLFNTILRTTLRARVTLELFFSARPLELPENFTMGEAPTKEYAQRAKSYVRTLILGEMDRQGLSHTELSRRSSVHPVAIRTSLREGKHFFTYLHLKAIVEDGLEIELPRFFLDFEENLKSFRPPEHAPAPVFSSRRSPGVDELIQRAAERLETITEGLGDDQPSSLKLDNSPSLRPHPTLGPFTKMANILHLSLVTKIPPGEILFGQGHLSPSLFDDTLHHSDAEETVRPQLSRLAQAIEARRLRAIKTRTDIYTGSGLSKMLALGPIFEGSDHASLPQFLQALEGLLHNPGLPGPENRVEREAIERLAREILSEIGQRETN